MYTSCVRVDKYVYGDIVDGSVVEYDYESWIDGSAFAFSKVTWPITLRNPLTNVHVEFTLVCEQCEIVDVIYTIHTSNCDKPPVRISYATSKLTGGRESIILYYFINDTHAGYNRPIHRRRLYTAVFNISENGAVYNTGKRQFCRKLQARVAALKMDAILDHTMSSTGEMFTFHSGANVEYIDAGCNNVDLRLALIYTSMYNIPLEKVRNILFYYSMHNIPLEKVEKVKNVLFLCCLVVRSGQIKY